MRQYNCHVSGRISAQTALNWVTKDLEPAELSYLEYMSPRQALGLSSIDFGSFNRFESEGKNHALQFDIRNYW